MRQTLIIINIFYLTVGVLFSQSTAEKKIVEGIILYEFSNNGEYYCEENSYIIVEGIRYYFYDIRYHNSFILNNYKDLQNSVGSDTLYIHFDKDPDSTINLNYSTFKNVSENIDGTSIISSTSFYYKKRNKKLYISFKFKGEIIHYNSVIYGRDIDIASSEEICCPENNKDQKEELIVLSEVLDSYPLNKKEQKAMKLKQSKIGEIKIFICE